MKALCRRGSQLSIFSLLFPTSPHVRSSSFRLGELRARSDVKAMGSVTSFSHPTLKGKCKSAVEFGPESRCPFRRSFIPKLSWPTSLPSEENPGVGFAERDGPDPAGRPCRQKTLLTKYCLNKSIAASVAIPLSPSRPPTSKNHLRPILRRFYTKLSIEVLSRGNLAFRKIFNQVHLFLV